MQAMAQQENNKEQQRERAEKQRESNDNEEIVIRQKADKDIKVTVEVKDGQVKVNGKPLSEFNDDNVVIRKRKANDAETRMLYRSPSPFRGGTSEYNNLLRGFEDSQKPFLGVQSEKDENGARITRITAGSAAEKAGLKEGDIITNVEGNKIEGPEDLTEVIGKLKPEDKASITIRRGKKEEKMTATLGKRQGLTSVFPENFNFSRDFNFDMISPDGNKTLWPGSVRLGIRAQDTEDGKGAKVLNVDDESNAEKAGIKEGDIITEFDGKAINSATELVEAAKAAREKNNIKIRYTRDGKNQEVEVKIPKKLKTANL